MKANGFYAEWQPIQTAPKTGWPSFLIFKPGCGVMQTMRGLEDSDLLDDRPAPTHWMPIPPEPKD